MNFLLMSFGAGVAAPPCIEACGDSGVVEPWLVAAVLLLLAWPIVRTRWVRTAATRALRFRPQNILTGGPGAANSFGDDKGMDAA